MKGCHYLAFRTLCHRVGHFATLGLLGLALGGADAAFADPAQFNHPGERLTVPSSSAFSISRTGSRKDDT